MALGQFAPHADHVHDREKSGALEIILRHRDRIGKQPADIRVALLDQGRRPRRDEAVDVARLEQSRDGLALGRIVEPHAGRQLHRDLFRPAGVLNAAADPVNVRALDAVIVFQESARPDIGGELIFRHADFAALEVLRRFHPVGADIDRGVAERARDEGRHRDIGTIALRRFHRIARHRQFANVELGGAEGAEENLLRHELHIDRIDAVDLDGAVDQRAGAVIVADRDREIELGHGKFPATYETVMPCSAVVTVPLSSTQAKAKVPLPATFTVNSKYGLAEIAGSRSARNTSWPLKVQTNELMISRGIGLPASSLRKPVSMTCDISVLIWMMSPFLASLGTRRRGFSAMMFCPACLLFQPPQPPTVTLTNLRSA